MPTHTTTSGSGSSGTTGTDAITIKNFAFGPTSLTVAPGATVTVTNKDSVAHTITSSKAGFDTGDIGPGQSKTFTAPKTPGSYAYICSIHQYMTGTLVVSG
jgi:plastocyanin